MFIITSFFQISLKDFAFLNSPIVTNFSVGSECAVLIPITHLVVSYQKYPDQHKIIENIQKGRGRHISLRKIFGSRLRNTFPKVLPTNPRIKSMGAITSLYTLSKVNTSSF
ncbi:unnamed protein product [Gordionus sp. m RMFG-2023]